MVFLFLYSASLSDAATPETKTILHIKDLVTGSIILPPSFCSLAVLHMSFLVLCGGCECNTHCGSILGTSLTWRSSVKIYDLPYQEGTVTPFSFLSFSVSSQFPQGCTPYSLCSSSGFWPPISNAYQHLFSSSTRSTAFLMFLPISRLICVIMATLKGLKTHFDRNTGKNYRPFASQVN